MARQIALRGAAGDILKALGIVGTVAGVVALGVKLFSPGQKCRKCDQVLKTVSALQMLCPSCNVVTFGA
jgi:hypothetical protein